MKSSRCGQAIRVMTKLLKVLFVACFLLACGHTLDNEMDEVGDHSSDTFVRDTQGSGGEVGRTPRSEPNQVMDGPEAGMGEVIITNQAELDTLAENYRQIGGNLTIQNVSFTQLDLSFLVSVSGMIKISGNSSLKRINLSNLEEAGTVWIYDNPKLTKIKLSNLNEVVHQNGIMISDHPKLEELDLSSLIRTYVVNLRTNDVLREANLPSLLEVHDLYIATNEMLHVINVPSLHSPPINVIFLENAACNDIEEQVPCLCRDDEVTDG